jgi:hypothetical protein
MDYDLGYFDLETRVLEHLDNPFVSSEFAWACCMVSRVRSR